MEHVTPTGGDQPTVPQMFATLLGEIAALRRQNEDQQRQLEHLRSTTSLILERDNVSLQTSGRLEFKHLPVEIREMIWGFAIPRRLLGFPGYQHKIPSKLSFPAVAQVCRESRRVFLAGKQYTKDGRSYFPTQLWRLKNWEDGLARWTSFTPRADALLVNPSGFLSGHCEMNYPITWVAEHIVVESADERAQFNDYVIGPGEHRSVTSWIAELAMFPQYSPRLKGAISSEVPLSTRAPVCHLRTVDFIMRPMTLVDYNYPPNLVRRLFAGDHVNIVDLRDRKAVDAIEHMIEHELFQVTEPAEYSPLPTDLEESMGLFRESATVDFPKVKRKLLRTLAKAFYDQSTYRVGSRETGKYLPPPIKDGKWDMEITWVKELCERIDVRPVHVFVRADGMSEVDW